MSKDRNERTTPQASGSAACSALKPRTIHTLRRLRLRLKQRALASGRYGPPFTEEAYDNRGPVPFRSFAYVDEVRHINALEDVIRTFEANHTERSLGMVKSDHIGDVTGMVPQPNS